MIQSRRHFFGAAASIVAVSAWSARSLAAQMQGPTTPPGTPMPSPIDPFPTGPIGGPMPTRRLSDAERLKMNQAQIRKDMVRLKEVVGELQKEFDANNTTKVLSLAAVHHTEEIERLARDIRGLLRG